MKKSLLLDAVGIVLFHPYLTAYLTSKLGIAEKIYNKV
jgi:hypothetical protein